MFGSLLVSRVCKQNLIRFDSKKEKLVELISQCQVSQQTMYLFLNVCSVFGTNNQLKTDEKKVQWKESMGALEKRQFQKLIWFVNGSLLVLICILFEKLSHMAFILNLHSSVDFWNVKISHNAFIQRNCN